MDSLDELLVQLHQHEEREALLFSEKTQLLEEVERTSKMVDAHEKIREADFAARLVRHMCECGCFSVSYFLCMPPPFHAVALTDDAPLPHL